MRLFKRITRRLNAERRLLPVRIREGLLSLIPEEYLFRRSVMNMPSSIRNMERNGFHPASIIEIGAYQGDWSRMARRIFPEASIFMVDANQDKDSILSAACREIGRAKHSIALLGPQPAESVNFYVMEAGSSVLFENTSVPRFSRRIPMATLDDLALAWEPIPGPYFIKLDVQGFEIEVLRGAERILAHTEAAQLEVSLLPYNEGAPLLAEVIAFMRTRGFVTYDVCGFCRRESDGTPFMLDLLFVREDSALRSKKPFWNLEAQFDAQAAGAPLVQHVRMPVSGEWRN